MISNLISGIARAALSKGLMFHGASILRNGRAYLFLAISGTGKSTISEFADRDGFCVFGDEVSQALLSDDKFILRPMNRQAETEVQKIDTTQKPIIQACFFIKQSKQIAATPLSVKESLKKCIDGDLVFGFKDMSIDEKTTMLDFLLSFLKATPCYELEFRRDNTFWQVIDKLEKLGFPEKIIEA